MNQQEKANKLLELTRNDAKNPDIRCLANRIWGIVVMLEPKETRRAIERFAHIVHCLVRDCIPYQTDVERVGREQIDGLTDAEDVSPLEPFRRSGDDCDAKARLFVAICLAGGLSARGEPVFGIDGILSHYAAFVTIDDQERHVECILRRARIGDESRNVPKERDGRWLR